LVISNNEKLLLHIL